ncbi:nitrate reductase [NADH] 3-like [Miscanthus floridulus]|uniref:nitrate reductase [NADH] 3-like n=1 Tax=Miscanthus floridulus TaxID=154761 RepID=UPI00345AA0DD
MSTCVEPPTHLASLEQGTAQRLPYPALPGVRGSGFVVAAPVSSTQKADDDASDDDDDEHQDDRHETYGSHYLRHLGVEASSVHDPRDEGTADAWVERSPSLIRLTGKHPFNGEPPLPQLMRHGFITPAPLHYVRNHGPVPRGDWATWTVEVSGLVRRPARFTMDELVRDFPALELPVTLVCSSNRRKEQNMARQTLGFNWGPGAVSTSVWRGARLRDVLRRCGGVADGALYVCFEGAEDLPGGGGSKYGTSITRERALDPTMDVMLAYQQNGGPLLPDHGFPVRLIVPGCTAGRMVKWLRRIVVTTAESDNYYHYRDNRFLPSHVDAKLADAEGWWYKPEYVINEMNTNSVITTPGHNDFLPINAITTQRTYTMKGFAYSGGGKKVTRVEVTLDGGENWLLCALDHPEKPTKYGRYWCWCFWSIDVELADLLACKEIAVRAWDQSLNTQPEFLTWNLLGMMTNCWFRVKVNVCRPGNGEIGLAFEHPVQPGNQPGGWMAQQKRLETAEAAGAAPALPPRSTSAATITNTANQFTMSEVRKHASQDSAWIIVHGHVYDCTEYLKDHPGGADSILINAGTDCTEEFDAIHSDKATDLLDAYRIGDLVTTAGTEQASHLELAPIGGPAAPVVALSNPREKVPCRLVAKTVLSREVRLFRFALPSSGQVLGLPVGKHNFVCASIDGKLCMRAYTPTSSVDEVGHFDLLVKVYFKNENPKFPDGGRMTQYLDSLPVGARVDVKGPLGHVEYVGRGGFVINGKPCRAGRLAMVAGGSGITPIYQVIQAVLRDQPEDRTEMHLVYANRTEDDILLRGELDRWAAKYPDRLKVWYVISQVKRPEEWKYSVGIVTEAILRKHVPEGGDGTLALVCGPPLMIQFAISPNLEKMKHHVDSVIVF